MRRWLPCALVLATTLACCHRMFGSSDDPQEPEQQNETNEKGPRRLDATNASPLTIPVGAGSSIRVELQLDRPRISVHDPGYATLVIRSSGPPLELRAQLPGGNGGYRTTSIRAAFRFADGAVYPQQVGEVQSTLHLEWRAIEHEVRRRLNLASWGTHVARGHAFLRIDTNLEARVDPNAEWRDVPVSIETPVDIGAEAADAGTVATDELGLGVVSAAYEDSADALDRLLQIRDPRALPTLLRLADVPHAEARGHAYRALVHFDDARAVAALSRGVAMTAADLETGDFFSDQARESTVGNLHRWAAYALADNPNPAAVAALLDHRGDTDADVRRAVVSRLSREATPAARAAMRAFAHDADASVRDAALESLARR